MWGGEGVWWGGAAAGGGAVEGERCGGVSLNGPSPMKWEREGPAQREGEGDLAMPNLRAKELRTAATDAEKKLWSLLCNRGLKGHKFRRQHPIGPFIADFACVESLLVVEVDGDRHTLNVSGKEVKLESGAWATTARTAGSS